MRKLILEEWISLDGYVSDKNGKLDFFTGLVRETYTDIHRLRFLETVDTILFGRTTYEQFASIWPQRSTDNDALATLINKGKKIVFSNTLTEAPWGKWSKVEVATGDTLSNVRKLKSLPGSNLILWGSVSLAHALMKENLIDEYHLHLCPTLTSGGRRLFSEEIDPINLELIETRRYGTGTVLLNYLVSTAVIA